MTAAQMAEAEQPSSQRRYPAGVVTAARLAHLAFFLLTSAYCLLTYNAFAYRQFLKPHLVVWLTDFVIWHHLWFWLVFGVNALTIAPNVRRGRAGWLAGASYLAMMVLVGASLLARPLLPQVENDWRGLVFALTALGPQLWLAWYDHLAAGPMPAKATRSDDQSTRAFVAAAMLLWVSETVAAPWLLTRVDEIRLTLPRLAFGAFSSAASHLAAFGVLALSVTALLRIARRLDPTGRLQYWVLPALATVGGTTAVVLIVFRGLAFTGGIAWIVAFTVALTVALTWSGVSRATIATRHASGPNGRSSAAAFLSPVDAWIAPLPGVGSRWSSAFALVVLFLAAAAAMKAVEPLDWDFLFQKLLVLFLWALTLAYACGVAGARAPRVHSPSVIALPFLGALLLAATPRVTSWTATQWVPAFALEGYAAVAPSFHVLHDVMRWESSEDREFYRFLRSHSNLDHAHIAPISIDFDPALTSGPRNVQHERPRSAERAPHIFLFVVDSLRRDYLSAYNPAVTFTPSIGALARDGVVFDRAFTRYGGTGLSVPAIWSGGMLVHKQYVTPFSPMNALMKLLEADGYRRIMSVDSVVAQIFPEGAADVELDRDVPIVDYDLCRTLGELRVTLDQERASDAPVFVYTLPQNLHISQVRSKPVPAGRVYPGFVPPVAAELERMDACLGTFIEDLRRLGIYDDSIIVVTADHGDSLGEARRWGHSYTMFPEIVRIPMLVHLPERLRARVDVDAQATVLSTDLTPSLYALLGHEPADLGPLYGRSVFHSAATPKPEASRREPLLLASSYGAVYAVVRDNGRSLFIADAVNNRDFAYDLSADVAVRVGVTDRSRTENRAFIREELDRLAFAYRFQVGQ